MGKRFAIVIGVAAAGVMTLGAQTATAATYNTRVTIGQGYCSPCAPYKFLHGNVYSAARKCEVGRRLVVFKQQPGTDRRFGGVAEFGHEDWPLNHWDFFPPAKAGWHVYALVRGEVRRHGLVCRSDRSRILTLR
jgi:hypothetical protein